jgi:hypothetical protein
VGTQYLYSRIYALRRKHDLDKEFIMPTNPSFPGPKPPESKPNERPGIGIFQMIGLGLILMFVLFLVIVVVGSLFEMA